MLAYWPWITLAVVCLGFMAFTTIRVVRLNHIANASEQILRQSIIDRKITQGSRSLMGREWNARIRTVLAACRKQSRSAWQSSQDVLSAKYSQTPIMPSLLPHA